MAIVYSIFYPGIIIIVKLQTVIVKIDISCKYSPTRFHLAFRFLFYFLYYNFCLFFFSKSYGCYGVG